MGLVKTRRLAAMQKQQRAKAGMKPPKADGTRKNEVARRVGPHWWSRSGGVVMAM